MTNLAEELDKLRKQNERTKALEHVFRINDLIQTWEAEFGGLYEVWEAADGTELTHRLKYVVLGDDIEDQP